MERRCRVLFLTQVWGYSILEAGFAVTPGVLVAGLALALGRVRASAASPVGAEAAA